MVSYKKIKYIYEWGYVAEIEAEVLEAEQGWSPYVSVSAALKLGNVSRSILYSNTKYFVLDIGQNIGVCCERVLQNPSRIRQANCRIH